MATATDLKVKPLADRVVVKPLEEAEQMRRAFSKGSFFNRRIRDRYACRELV